MRFITLILFFYFPFATLSQDTEEKKNNLNLPGYLKLNFGFTFLEDNNHSLQTDIFPSRSLDIFYSKPIFLLSKTSARFNLNFSALASVIKKPRVNIIFTLNVKSSLFIELIVFLKIIQSLFF